MVLWGIFISAFLIGFSGAMMPGPMLGVTIDGSLKKGWTAGPLTVLVIGVLVFFAGHVLSDFVWYTAISTAFSRGKKLTSDAAYRWVILLLGIFIVAFSIYFIGSGWKMLLM